MKALLLISILASTGLAQAEVVANFEGRTECRYEVKTDQNAQGHMNSTKQETCVEEPGVEVRSMNIGDMVRGVQLPQHPVIKQDFVYRHTVCRWFAETGSNQRDLVQYQGIACQVQPNIWQVIDKF